MASVESSPLFPSCTHTQHCYTDNLLCSSLVLSTYYATLLVLRDENLIFNYIYDFPFRWGATTGHANDGTAVDDLYVYFPPVYILNISTCLINRPVLRSYFNYLPIHIHKQNTGDQYQIKRWHLLVHLSKAFSFIILTKHQ